MAPSLFSIVRFMGNYERELLDIVPISWVTEKGNVTLCQYPQKKDYSILHALVQQQDPPNTSWKYYKVSVLQEAEDYEQAVRRMDRLRKTLTATFTTDDENVDPNCRQLVPITEQTKKKLFGKRSHDDLDLSASSAGSSDNTLVLQSPRKRRAHQRKSTSLSPSPDRTLNPKPRAAKGSAQKRSCRGISASPTLSPDPTLPHTTKGSAPKRSRRGLSASPSLSPDPTLPCTPKTTLPAISQMPLPEHPIDRTPSTVRNATGFRQKSLIQEASPSVSQMLSPELAIDRTPSIVGSEAKFRNRRLSQEISSTIPTYEGVQLELHNNSAKYVHDVVTMLQKNIFTKMSAIRSSLNYDLKAAVAEIKTFVSNRLDNACVKPVINAERELQMTFPITTDVDFQEFDSTLKDKTRETLMVNLMTMWGSEKNYSEAVANIITRLLSKEVQVLYSGAGKFAKQGGKKNYSESNCYKIMESYIVSKFERGCNSMLVRQSTTKYLAGAEDRKGGRKARKDKKESRADVQTTVRPNNLTSENEDTPERAQQD